jgi:restriction system protein
VARRRTPTRRTRRPSKADKATGCIIGVLFLVLIPLAVLAKVTEAHPAVGALLVLAAGGAASLVITRRIKARNRRQALWAARANAIGSYMHMSPAEFEHALAYLCQRDGCTHVQVVGGAGDLGADVIATTPDGRRIVLQAKRYGPGTTVGSGDVQKVNGTYHHAHGAHLAAIVTTSRFTKPALAYGQQVGIRLFDQQALAGWVSRTGPAPWH